MKHGDPSQPSSVAVLVTSDHAKLTTLNHLRTEISPVLTGTTLGLHGVRQRVAELGGTVSAGQIGTQWQTHILLPSRTTPDPRIP